MPEKQRVADAASTEPLWPSIDAEASRTRARRAHLRLAHWAACLSEATPALAQLHFEAYQEICPIPERCASWHACMWAHERAMRVARAREQLRSRV